ncbi:PQQ-like beta-propeller repeat protein [Caulobacter mirabilis]|uniref:Dehydrogenase n=1 Tax=Caulobacter mirabilis TaxID=69666 RepID=A0A2D2AZ44_9CAUL|nr:PQQ-like beta-propeller repeat protein [Caulobacter mirabilis]ATQ43273.1 dehydrogenase [Caulobacter mirabilis]
MTKRIGGVAVIAASALALAGCSTLGSVSNLNPFKKNENKEVATDGRRISIVAFDQKVEASESLKGADFNLPPATAIANWPQPGGAPDVVVDHVQAAASFDVAWRKGFGKGSNRALHLLAPPVYADGRIYVMDAEGEVAAVDARTGSVIWRKPPENRTRRDKQAFGGGVAYADGKVYVSSGYRYVARLDAATGALEWKTNSSAPIHGAPIVTQGRVYVVNTDNEMLTYDVATGTQAWTYQALVEPARILAASSPAAQGDTIVAGFASGEVVALRAGNGNDLWNNTLAKASRTSALSEIRDVAGRPVIYQGDVYAASHSGVFGAIDLRSGQSRWSLPIASITTPWPAGDVVYVISQAGEVICASRESGQVYWIKDLNAGLATAKKSKLFFGMAKQKVRPLFSGPILASDRLIVVSSDGRAIALNPKTGDFLKEINLGGPALVTPIAGGDTVYVVTDKAELVAIR